MSVLSGRDDSQVEIWQSKSLEVDLDVDIFLIPLFFSLLVLGHVCVRLHPPKHQHEPWGQNVLSVIPLFKNEQC